MRGESFVNRLNDLKPRLDKVLGEFHGLGFRIQGWSVKIACM